MSWILARTPRFWLALIVAVYLFLAVGFGIANPIFEAPDEHHHFFTAQYIADHGRLPVVDPANEWIGQEAAQPPLYYLLGSLLIRPIETGVAEDWVWPNPFVRLGDASWPNNWNAFVHTDQENWPWRGPVLAVHLLRLFSAVLGAGTLLFIYGTARLVWPEQPDRWLLATAVVAFLPQFTFLHGAVTNDALIILLSAAGLWQLVRLWLQPVTRGRLLLLGLTVGLAALTKATGLLLLLYAMGFLLLRAWRDGRQETAWQTAVYLLLPALLLSGWLYGRNWLLYGDPTAANQFVSYFGGSRAFGLREVLAESSGLWLSLFAVFGWFNVRPPDWIYWAWNGVVLAAAAGAFKNCQLRITNYQLPTTNDQLRRLCQRPEMLGWLLLGWFLLVYAGLIRFMMLTPAAQGRLLFPALIPLSLALAYGFSCWRRGWLTLLVPLLALITSLYSLLVVVPGAYAAPDSLAVGDWPETAVPFYHDLGQGVELIAVQMATTSAQPGDAVWLTLYSRRTSPPPGQPAADNAPELVIDIFGAEMALVGKLQTYHGQGLYPANLWPEGMIVADRLRVDLAETMIVPVEAWLDLRLAGAAEGVRIGAVKVMPAQWPPLPRERLAQFGAGLELAAAHFAPQPARPGERLLLTTSWVVTAAPDRDFTLFFHLGDPTTPPLAQGDSPPRGGSYPTRYWAAGELIDDWYTLSLPPELADGRYPLWIGFYDPVSGERLTAVVNGERQPHDAYLLGYLTVE
jgi:4-amino-4-deoxy-L-arabinose transferase-like glycosyltransferase